MDYVGQIFSKKKSKLKNKSKKDLEDKVLKHNLKTSQIETFQTKKTELIKAKYDRQRKTVKEHKSPQLKEEEKAESELKNRLETLKLRKESINTKSNKELNKLKQTHDSELNKNQAVWKDECKTERKNIDSKKKAYVNSPKFGNKMNAILFKIRMSPENSEGRKKLEEMKAEIEKRRQLTIKEFELQDEKSVGIYHAKIKQLKSKQAKEVKKTKDKTLQDLSKCDNNIKKVSKDLKHLQKRLHNNKEYQEANRKLREIQETQDREIAELDEYCLQHTFKHRFREQEIKQAISNYDSKQLSTCKWNAFLYFCTFGAI